MSTSTLPADWPEIAWNKLDTDLRVRAVNILRDYYAPQFFKEVRELVDTKGLGKWAPPGWHHGQGMHVRNTLRQGGIADSLLPTLPEVYGQAVSNWDDYYMQVVEAAAGLRPIHADYESMPFTRPAAPTRRRWRWPRRKS